MPRRRAGVLLPIEEQILEVGIRRAPDPDPDFHGFALADELSEFDPRRVLGHGTLYKALARLERDGLITSRWEEVDPAEVGRPRRRLYRVTPSAADALDRSRRLRDAGTRRLAAP